MTKKQALSWINDHPEIEMLRVAVCDLNGVLRGKLIPVSQAKKALSDGIRMPLSIASSDIWGEDIAGSELVFTSGDADGVCKWTGRNPVPISWLNKPTGLIPLVLCEENGDAFLGDPRQALNEIVLRFEKLGLTPVVATELEFYLIDPNADQPCAPKSPLSGKRLDSDNVLSVDELDAFDAFIGDVYQACKDQCIPADAAIAENGAGQFEINLLHTADPLKAADDAVLFKRIVKGVARKHGFAASFMAKPYGNQSGSGMHVHFSLLDEDGNNVFDDGNDLGSNVLKHAVAGMMAALSESTLIFAPHFNSYRRLQPESHAPTAICWGYENRTAAIRIPGGNTAARRIEHRVAGADANPYLVLAAILGSALNGLEEKLSPPDAIHGDAYSLNLEQLPTSWTDAISALLNGDQLKKFLAPVLLQSIIACKQQEQLVFAKQISEFEYRSYLEIV